MPYLPDTDPAKAVADRWIFFGLLALLVWAPLPLGSNRVWAIGLLLAFVSLLLAGTLLAWRRTPGLAWQRLAAFRWPLGLLGLMLTLSWLQTVPLPPAWVAAISPNAAMAQAGAASMTLSLDVYQSRIMAGLSFVYFGIFLVTVLTVRQAGRLDALAQVLVWSGVAQAVLAVVLLSFKADYTLFFFPVSHGQAKGTFVYHNHLAGYLCMTLSIGIGLMLARLTGKPVQHHHWRTRLLAALEFALSPKMRLRLLLIIMVIALVLTRSRMGNTAFFAAMLVVGGLAIVLARKTAPQTIALIISLVVIDILVIGTAVGLEKVVERIQGTEVLVADGGTAESIEARSAAARTSLAIVQDYPLVGTGGGSFYNIFLSYRTPQYAYSYVDHTHNDYVEIATDFGLIGLGILGVLVASTLWAGLRIMSQRKSPLPWGIAFGATMSIVALLLHSSVDFNLQLPANALTIVVILAMVWAAKTLPPNTRQRSTRHQ